MAIDTENEDYPLPVIIQIETWRPTINGFFIVLSSEYVTGDPEIKRQAVRDLEFYGWILQIQISYNP